MGYFDYTWSLTSNNISILDATDSLGCWHENNAQPKLIPSIEKTDDRILDKPYKNRTDAFDKCYQVVSGLEISVFSLRDGGACCATNKSAENAYDAYMRLGQTTGCILGRGEQYKNDVYIINSKLAHRISVSRF